MGPVKEVKREALPLTGDTFQRYRSFRTALHSMVQVIAFQLWGILLLLITLCTWLDIFKQKAPY